MAYGALGVWLLTLSGFFRSKESVDQGNKEFPSSMYFTKAKAKARPG